MRSALSAVLLLFVAAGCGDGDHGSMMMTSPSGSGSQAHGPALVSITPAAGSTGVPTATTISLRFGAPMAVVMEQYVDVHVGAIAGPVVPMSCTWSPDRAVLTCVPVAALEPHTTYVVHVGGGMMSQAGLPIDFDSHGPPVGGQWILGGMMGPAHGGHPWGMMGPGWRHANGSYGMQFAFTTG